MSAMEWSERYALGISSMDGVHKEFMQLQAACADAPDSESFMHASGILRAHMLAHFEGEKGQMEACGFPMIRVHLAEHTRVLNEFDAMLKRPLPLAQAYLSEHVPAWFEHHLGTMDSALAACLRHARMD